MTIYAGEGVRLWAYGNDFTPSSSTSTPPLTTEIARLTNDDVQSVTVSVWKTTAGVTPVLVVNEQTMAWDADNQDWGFIWDTTGMDPGTFRARVTITPLTGPDSIEWGRFRLAKQPITV